MVLFYLEKSLQSENLMYISDFFVRYEYLKFLYIKARWKQNYHNVCYVTTALHNKHYDNLIMFVINTFIMINNFIIKKRVLLNFKITFISKTIEAYLSIFQRHLPNLCCVNESFFVLQLKFPEIGEKFLYLVNKIKEI